MKIMKKLLVMLMLIVTIVVLTACAEGANSSSWRMSVNQSERSFDGGFEITVGSARSGHRNRTVNLTADELASIRISSTSTDGEIILVISQDGEEDGTETILDISNFTDYITVANLNPGRIRFSLRFEDIRNSETTIRWR